MGSEVGTSNSADLIETDLPIRLGAGPGHPRLPRDRGRVSRPLGLAFGH